LKNQLKWPIKKAGKFGNSEDSIMKPYKPFLEKFLLQEGKQQAIQVLKNEFGKATKDIVNELEKLDPTSPKNKYIEPLAKILLYTSKTSGKNYTVDVNLKRIKDTLNDYDIEDKILDIEKRNLSINLSKIKTVTEFIDQIEEVYSTITRSKEKQGLQGLTKNKDYIEIPLPDKDFKAYIPLNHKASRIIASNRVGGCEGKWCTAQNTSDHWDQYIERVGGILVYIVDSTVEQKYSRLEKVAIFFYPDKKARQQFDINDDSIPETAIDFDREIVDFVHKNWDKIKEKLPKIALPTYLYFEYIPKKDYISILDHVFVNNEIKIEEHENFIFKKELQISNNYLTLFVFKFVSGGLNKQNKLSMIYGSDWGFENEVKEIINLNRITMNMFIPKQREQEIKNLINKAHNMGEWPSLEQITKKYGLKFI